MKKFGSIKKRINMRLQAKKSLVELASGNTQYLNDNLKNEDLLIVDLRDYARQ